LRIGPAHSGAISVDQLSWMQREFGGILQTCSRQDIAARRNACERASMRAAGFECRIVLSLLLGAMLGAASLRGEEPTAIPPEARDRFNQARDLQKKGQLKEAISAYEKAIQSGMQAYPRAHLYRADSFRDLKDYDKAIAQYTKFIEEFGLEQSCRY
jgi:tetratricopeptide (TPR) repeat protein